MNIFDKVGQFFNSWADKADKDNKYFLLMLVTIAVPIGGIMYLVSTMH